jgi:small subunit ribosomal protein S16
VDTLGTYDPGTDPATVRIDVPKADEWIRKGARPSNTVKSLLERARSAQQA